MPEGGVGIVPEYLVEKDKAGHVVARYTRGKLLGKGGFAKCYEAVDCDGGEAVAVKVVSKATLAKPKTRQKLKTEIKIHRAVGHRYIVGFKKYFEDEHNVYILLELCKGQTLMDHCNRKGSFTEEETAHLMHQVLQALKYMHQLGVIHRDLKLGNIMLSSAMEAKIGDFGLAAKLYFPGEKRRTLCGTPNYIAPEILASGHGHSYEVDVWTVGVIIYAMLVGKPPFQTGDVKATYGRIKKCSYTFPPHTHISKEARDLISSILQVTPEGRPTVDQLLTHPWFKLYPPRKHAPLSLFTPGTSQYTRQKRLLEEDKQHHPRSSSVPAKPKREPLGRIDTNAAHSQPKHHRVLREMPDVLRNLHSSPVPKGVQRYRSSASPSQSPPLRIPSPGVRSASAGGRREAFKPTLTTKMSSPRRVARTPSITPPRSVSVPRAFHSRSPSAPLSAAKQDLVEVRCGREDEEARNLTVMRDKLEETLLEGAKGGEVVGELEAPTLWVTEYTDFTSKYGLAYRLSNGQVGVHFNDSTKIVYVQEAGEMWYVGRSKRGAVGEQVTRYSVGSHPEELKKKVTLVKYFANYIQKMKGRRPKEGQAEVVSCSNAPIVPSKETEVVYVRKWLNTGDATIFRLSNKKVQVSFNDKTEILISSEAKLVTYTDKTGKRTTMLLSSIAKQQSDISTRLKYTRDIIGKLINVNK